MKNKVDVYRIEKMRDYYEAARDEPCECCPYPAHAHSRVPGFPGFVRMCNGDLYKI